MTTHHVSVDNIKFGNDLPFVLLAGPCVLENREHAMMMAGALKEITDRLEIPFIYKTSFDKANRTSVHGIRGVGLEAALPIFKEIKERFGCPVITDVHSPEQCATVAEAVDVLQIPAFLCRQTDLLKAAAETGKILNIKKGQFLAPWDMVNVVKKVESFGNRNILQCERGVSFGYNTLVSDMRSLAIMARNQYPVVYDATHSVQQPGGAGASSSGDREFVPVLAKAAIAVGVAAVFMEVHQDPDNAPSDGPNMVKLHELENLLKTLKKLDAVAKTM